MGSPRKRSLWLLRHATAEPRAAWPEDHLRPLARRGHERLVAARPHIRSLTGEDPLVLHSPWRRAAETASALFGGPEGRLVETPRLAAAPGPGLLGLLAELRERNVVLVGHEPWLSELAEVLTGAPLPGALKKLGLVHLAGSLAPGELSLERLWRPRELRQPPRKWPPEGPPQG